MEVSQDNGTRPPPTTLRGILKELGPGLIVAGAVVGSGELIATTATGAEAGFYFLWLILIGCTIKVFVQVEMGRYAICNGRTSLDGMSEVPGPSIGRFNWVLWFWVVTIIVTTGQLGGIVGGVGQALAIMAPITAEGRAYNEAEEARSQAVISRYQNPDHAASEQVIPGEVNVAANDHKIWAAIVAILSTFLLVWGRYRFIQYFITILVAAFTLFTVVNVVLLQRSATYAISLQEFWTGLTFSLPPATEGLQPLATALATFGIIGIAAGEMVYYPYWCQEKGYARFVGVDDGSEEWVARAQGWMRVLRWDAFGSMVVYTISTVAFYMLGAAILNRINLVPQGIEMIRTLSLMYLPVFGPTIQWLFLLGAVAVLYSTFFVTNASKARMCNDAMRIFQLRADNPPAAKRWFIIFSIAFPVMCLFVYLLFPRPTQLVLYGGVMQAILLPVMAFTAIWFRYRRCPPRIMPGRKWDVLLWLSGLGMLIAGGWLTVTKLATLLG